MCLHAREGWAQIAESSKGREDHPLMSSDLRNWVQNITNVDSDKFSEYLVANCLFQKEHNLERIRRLNPQELLDNSVFLACRYPAKSYHHVSMLENLFLTTIEASLC